jgi:hypothetical protein
MTEPIELYKKEEIAELQHEIEDSFRKLQFFRSRFLMETSVLAMQATTDGKYWQALLERDVHFRELTRLKFDFDEKVADIKINEAILMKKKAALNSSKGKRSISEFDRAILESEIHKLEIQVNRANVDLIYMQKEAEQRIREITEWTDIIKKIKPQLKYSSEDPEEYQAEEWAKKYAQQLELLKNPLISNQSDMSGAMNILTVANTLFKHPGVIPLIEEEKKQLEAKSE